ncbi:multidrug efflux SMR transporter [Mammaliicoccus sp. Dog046]|uniref:DMT family transporter n=1 Tax=Mammaliicoccus sp. Dog046 TaxID=3034233 RepID=UPI002B261F91|nr:multidrug efflux SMR transporter [Mammaliicoccus sp. Dog046]WQK85383.1 multidrug efflux SMR transporter [Mammaliicoccus sp. Dog046]
MNWLKIVIGALFEVGWVVGLTHANNTFEWILTIIAIVVSFYLLIHASKQLPVGTAYAVYVGLGASGVTIADFVFFGEPVIVGKVLLIVILIIGVVGLKLVTNEKEGA